MMSVPSMPIEKSDSSMPQARLLDHPSGAVPIDFPCRKCGYNLRAQPLEGRCPECGDTVNASVSGALVNYADRTWLSEVADAVNGLLIMIILAAAARVSSMMSMDGGIIVVLFLVVPVEFVQLDKILRVIRAPNDERFPRLNAQYRSAITFCFVISLIGSVVISAIPWLATNTHLDARFGKPFAGLIGLSTMAWLGGWSLLFRYFAALAAAIPHASTERYCKTYQIAALVGVALVVIMILGAGSPSTAMAVIAVVTFVGILTMGVLILGMLIRLKRLLRTELEKIDAIEQTEDVQTPQIAS